MNYNCEDCEYYRQYPKKDPITGRSPALKVMCADINELSDMLIDRLRQEGFNI